MVALLGLILVVMGAGWWFYGGRVLRKNRLELTPKPGIPTRAVLIPARDEGAVIEGLLLSLQEQTLPVPMRDVYVIVERADDPTVGIAERYGARVIFRTNLKRQRKGYALDEALKQILPRWRYDLYFIFDADNILARDYMEQILESYAKGYQLATGYRNSKNANANVVAAVSSLTFSMINVLGNKNRIKKGANVIFSGTGCYVDGRLIDKWQGWPFHSLTEDYEMSLYATLHSIPTFYNEEAEFYDEQPTRYRQTVDQRVRWIKGYFSARRKYIPLMRKRKRAQNIGSIKREAIGVRPIIMMLVGVIVMIVGLLVELCLRGEVAMAIGLVIALLAVVYLVLMFITLEMVKREKIKLRKQIKWRAVLFNPLYLVTYIPCALRALLVRDVKWKKIDHGK